MLQIAPASLFGSSSMANFGNSNQSQWSDKNSNVATPKAPNLSLSGGLQKGSSSSSMVETMASLFSDSQSHQPKPALAPMSATALLQKAAQMGSTTSNASPPFLGNNFMKHPEIMASLPGGDSVVGSSGLSSLAASSSGLEQIMLQSSGLAQCGSMQPLKRGSGSESGLTRDFLGMGGEGAGSGHPFLPQELAKFASMGSTMGLSHFTGNH